MLPAVLFGRALQSGRLFMTFDEEAERATLSAQVWGLVFPLTSVSLDEIRAAGQAGAAHPVTPVPEVTGNVVAFARRSGSTPPTGGDAA